QYHSALPYTAVAFVCRTSYPTSYLSFSGPRPHRHLHSFPTRRSSDLVPRESGGERVMAAVIARDGATVDVDEVSKWLRERLVAYKVPRQITVVDELPKSMLGKVLRKEVRNQLIDNEKN